MTGRFERVEMGAGAGLVAVVGEIALFVADGEAAGRLVELAREAVAEGLPPGRALARRLAAHVTGEGDGVSDFGAVAADDNGWILLLHGSVTASFTSGDGAEQHLSGADSVTWLDRVLPAGIGPVAIAPAGVAPPAASPASLEAGVVPGGWLRAILPATDDVGVVPVAEDVPAAPVADDPAVAPVAPDLPVAASVTSERSTITGRSATMPPPPTDGDATSPVPTPGSGSAGTPPAERELPTGEVELFSLAAAGVEPRDALPIDGTTGDTEPASAGSGELAATVGSSPSLGVLVFDDGSTYALDGDYVVGREPDTDVSVVEGRARVIVLDDPDGTVSRVHAEIRVVGGDVQLVDRGSTNGTHIWDTSAGAWSSLTPGEPRSIHPGERAAFGQRTFVYERPATPVADTAPSPRSAATMAVSTVVGVLTGEDGAAYPLDRDYVIGRDPMSDDAVRQALASPIVVRDDPQVAAVHARISVVAGTVHVRDAGTPTGTFAAAPGASAWDPVGADPVELKPNWSMRVGRQVLTFRAVTS